MVRFAIIGEKDEALQLPDLRVRKRHVGRVGAVFAEYADFAGSKRAIAGGIDELFVDVEVQVVALSHEGDRVGLIQAALEILRITIDQTGCGTGLAALVDKKVICAVRIDTEQVVFGVVGIGSEKNAALISLRNGHLHLEGEVIEGRVSRVAGLKVSFGRHIRVIRAIGKLATPANRRVGGRENIPVIAALRAQIVVEYRCAARSVGQNALVCRRCRGRLGIGRRLGISCGAGNGVAGGCGCGSRAALGVGRSRQLSLRGSSGLVMLHFRLIHPDIIDKPASRQQEYYQHNDKGKDGG